MRYLAASALVASTMLCGQAWAINKCIGADGKPVFQDHPCADGRGGKIDVRPASGSAPIPPRPVSDNPSVPTTASNRPLTQAEKDEALSKVYQRDSRIISLEVRLVPDAKNAVNRKRLQCDSELAQLRARKQAANNNLAGATWEQSISAEMQAIATRCDTENRLLQSDVARLEKELTDLQAAKSR